MRFDDLVVTPSSVRFYGRKFPRTLGRGGLTYTKSEGDGATPYGIHRVIGCLYRPDRVARPNSWATPIGLFDLWSDDSRAKDYNQLVKAPYPFSHEKLRRSDPLYDLILLTDWNWPNAEPGNGSAIFIHRWRKVGHPTEGCIAFKPNDLAWIAAHVQIGTRIIIR